MTGIGQHAPFALQAHLDAFEELIQRDGKPLDLVARVGNGQPVAQIAGADARGAPTHRLHGLKRASGHAVATDAGEQKGGGHREHQQQTQPREVGHLRRDGLVDRCCERTPHAEEAHACAGRSARESRDADGARGPATRTRGA